MGQYFKLVNEDKRQVVIAGDLHGFSTFHAWLCTNQARVLIWLLRQSSEGGGGDIPDHTRYSMLGRWAGDRVTLIGDYDASGLYQDAEGYKNISAFLLADYNRAAEEHGLVRKIGL